MKIDNSKFDKDGKLKNGVYKEYFKDRSVSCEGYFKDGERTGEWKYYLAKGKLKAIGNFEPSNFNQIINYLEAFQLEIGLLINFGKDSLDFKHFTNNKLKTD